MSCHSVLALLSVPSAVVAGWLNCLFLYFEGCLRWFDYISFLPRRRWLWWQSNRYVFSTWTVLNNGFASIWKAGHLGVACVLRLWLWLMDWIRTDYLLWNVWNVLLPFFLAWLTKFLCRCTLLRRLSNSLSDWNRLLPAVIHIVKKVYTIVGCLIRWRFLKPTLLLTFIWLSVLSISIRIIIWRLVKATGKHAVCRRPLDIRLCLISHKCISILFHSHGNTHTASWLSLPTTSKVTSWLVRRLLWLALSECFCHVFGSTKIHISCVFGGLLTQ